MLTYSSYLRIYYLLTYLLTHLPTYLLTYGQRMEELETSFDVTATRLLRFVLSEAPRNVTDAIVPTLLAASAQFDVTRHRGELDDGHLSPRQHGPAATLTLALALA